jgi:glycosyltransferase involved in cell wall biosynthesis
MALSSPKKSMRIVQITTDNRESLRQYEKAEPWFGAAPEALLQGLAMTPDVEVHVISCTQRPMYAPEKLAENIWFHSLHVKKWGWLRTGYQGCIRAVRREVRKLRPDVVHGQGTERDCALCAAFSSFPNVVTIHGNMAAIHRLYQSTFGSYYWFAANLENLAIRKTSGVFCNSAYTENLVRPRAKQTWRVPNAIRGAFLSNMAEGRVDATPLIVNVGVISERKRQVQILEIADDLFRRGYRFVLHFVGSLDDRSPYGRLFSERLRVARECGYAELTLHMNVEQLARLFDRAHAMIHFPSEEAFGLVVAEALARNLKLFGSRVGGIPDIAQGVEGVALFEPGAVDELSDALQQWLKKGFPRLTSAAETIRARYCPATVAAEHVRIYQQILHQKPSSKASGAAPNPGAELP